MRNILLLHGAIGSKNQLQGLADILSKDHTVHSLNFSGHGGEPFLKDFSIPQFAMELVDFIEDLDTLGAPVNIFGYSMGGYVAMYLAKHHPHLVNKIITLGTKYNWDESIAAKEVKMLDAEKIAEKVPAFAKQLEELHAPNDWKLVLKKTSEMLIQMGKDNPLKLEDYESIHITSLLLLGDNDKMVTVEETEAVTKALPNARFEILKETPHPIEQVDMEGLGKKIEEFLI